MTFYAVWHYILLWRVPDYLTILALVLTAQFVGSRVRPHCRPFRWTDPAIMHPRMRETYPDYSIVTLVYLASLLYIPGELLTRWRRKLTPRSKLRIRRYVEVPSATRSPRNAASDRTGDKKSSARGGARMAARKVSAILHAHGWFLTHLYSCALAYIISNLAKLYAGRLRPDFIARLAREGIFNDGSFNSTVASGPICDAAREGRLSFPSGHAALSFACCLPVCVYAFGLTRQLRRGNGFVIPTLCLVPMIFPIAIAISRTVQNRHNYDDILAGAVIGSGSALFAILLSFRNSDTGEWTLRSLPMDRRDQIPTASCSEDDVDAQRNGASGGPEVYIDCDGLGERGEPKRGEHAAGERELSAVVAPPTGSSSKDA